MCWGALTQSGPAAHWRSPQIQPLLDPYGPVLTPMLMFGPHCVRFGPVITHLVQFGPVYSQGKSQDFPRVDFKLVFFKLGVFRFLGSLGRCARSFSCIFTLKYLNNSSARFARRFGSWEIRGSIFKLGFF